MYTQCPHCQTLFRIRAEQLRIAGGKAHCCECSSLFNALENLREHPNEQESCQTDREQPQQNLPFDEPSSPLDNHQDAVLNNLTDLLKALESDNTLPPPEDVEREAEVPKEKDEAESIDQESFPIDFGPDSTLSFSITESSVADEPESLPGTQENEQIPSSSGSIDSSFSTYSKESETTEETPCEEELSKSGKALAPSDEITDEATPQQTISNEEVNLPFTVPENLPDIPPNETPLLPGQVSGDNKRKRGGILGWSLAIISLLILALAQATWFGREHLLQYPEGRQLLQFVCSYTNCQLPLIKATEKITVISRSINTHPDADNALLVLMTFANKSTYPQPFPHLQLTLFGNNDQLAARRVFQPSEYLKNQADTDQPLQPGKIIQVEIELKDPGENVTGFRFDFI